MGENKIYVAVGKEVEERESTLNWALQFSAGATICVIHVHIPSQFILQPNGFRAPLKALTEVEVNAYRELERREVHKMLDDCLKLFDLEQVQYEKIVVEQGSVTDGILELISQLGIRKLVMGSGSNSKFIRRLTKPTSRKSYYVLQCAPDFCHIWFVSKGRLIFKRERMKQLNQQLEENQLNRLSYSSVDSPSTGSPGSSSPLYQNMYHVSPPATVLPNGIHDNPCDQLQKALAEAKRARQEACEESQRRQKAEEKATETIVKLKSAEEELSTVMRDLKATQSKLKVLKMLTHTACDNSSSSNVSTFSYEISQLDLNEATKFFNLSLRIREGDYGSVYKGFLHNTEVAIKKLNPDSLQGIAKFRQEVDVLSKLRHPNLVTLIGACPDSLSLVYEYLPNGSLDDRLSCKDNTSPLPWQTRICIVTELCSVLHFLHSIQPCSIIHSDLNPKNVLLDANFSCKLSGFGFCHIISYYEQTVKTDELMGTSSYTDPEFLEAGYLSLKSDVYSFGIILLRLLTGRPALDIVKEVQHALENDSLHSILDPSAGNWPVVRAKHLAYMALKCCEVKAKDRPDLGSEVWRVLKPVMTPTKSLSSRLLVSGDQVPSYFICPIFQEIMRDPHFAADGFTYEADGVRGWFESGHNTSPMTNLRLDNLSLTPNRALRSAIQDWLQKHQNG